MLHLGIAAFAEGGRVAIATAVPSGLRKLWISKDGLLCVDAKQVRTTVYLTDKDTRGYEYNLSALDDSGKKVLMRGDGLRLTIVVNATSTPPDTSDEAQRCYHLVWKPDTSLMTNQQLAAYCEQARHRLSPT